MPLLDSFKVDHTKMEVPSVRLGKTMVAGKDVVISVYDVRITKPNVEEPMSSSGIHTLEHLFAGFLRSHLEDTNFEVIDCSPMGCRTGFYLSVIGKPEDDVIANAVDNAMLDVSGVDSIDDIPELNEYQCGTYTMHSLPDAVAIAKKVWEKGVSVVTNDSLEFTEELKEKLKLN